MLKYKTSKLTEAIDCYFDMALCEADPAVNISGNDNSELMASRNSLEQFLSNAFSDHSEDIKNVELNYDGENASINVILNDDAEEGTLESLYRSKFELAGKENGSFKVIDTVDTEQGFTINVSLSDGTNDLITDEDVIDDNSTFEEIERVVDTEYTFEDLERITSGTGAEVVVDDFSLNGAADVLTEIVNNQHFTSDDEVIEFIETSGEVEEMRNAFNESEITNLSQTRVEEPISFKTVDVDLSNVDNMIGKYVKIGNFYHEVLGVMTYDNMYVIDFAASTDGKQPGGQFEPGTIEEIDSLQFFEEQKEEKLEETELDGIDYGDDEYVEPDSFDDIVSEAVWEAIDKLDENRFDYTQDGFAGQYVNTFFDNQTGHTVASIMDEEIEGMSKDEMVAYFIKKIEEGIKYNEENPLDDEDLEESEKLEEASLKDGIAPFNNAWQEAKFLEAEMRFSKPDISKVRESVHTICDNLDELGDILKDVTSKGLTEQVVPASELGFKHQELAKIEDEVALISKLKGEDPGNELYTELLGCFDKAIEILKDAIGEEPIGTIVGKDDVSVTIDSEDNKLGGAEEEVEAPIEDAPVEDMPAEDLENVEEEI